MMRIKQRFVLSAVLAVAGLSLLVNGLNGNVNLSVGSSLDANFLNIQARTSGLPFLLGLLGMAAGLVLFFIALFTSEKQREKPGS